MPNEIRQRNAEKSKGQDNPSSGNWKVSWAKRMAYGIGIVFTASAVNNVITGVEGMPIPTTGDKNALAQNYQVGASAILGHESPSKTPKIETIGTNLDSNSQDSMLHPTDLRVNLFTKQGDTNLAYSGDTKNANDAENMIKVIKCAIERPGEIERMVHQNPKMMERLAISAMKFVITQPDAIERFAIQNPEMMRELGESILQDPDKMRLARHVSQELRKRQGGNGTLQSPQPLNETERIDILEQEYTSQQGQIDSLNSTVTYQQKEINDIGLANDDLQRYVYTGLQPQIDSLRSTVTSQQGQIDSLSSTSTFEQEEINNLTQQYNDLQGSGKGDTLYTYIGGSAGIAAILIAGVGTIWVGLSEYRIRDIQQQQRQQRQQMNNIIALDNAQED